ncbi:hypothetical protein D1B31_02755 [Neobacillus notoginsengisoli]|uniref:Uncharacterized protein n=1 Tax=Neobacillus notoginsengisoli TaxID=1578198 RepID=A0A417YYD2_9BACI|nr:hypothetical protein [Neobacillus notoginsengisoli]RHW42537.1 hypothetical protein D1B31_02755 [Neobacillus notoginsengisoli]
MRNILFYILIALMLTTIISIVLGYHSFGFTVGFIFAGFALAVGVFYSMKNRDYTYKQWYDDYVDRKQRRK